MATIRIEADQPELAERLRAAFVAREPVEIGGENFLLDKTRLGLNEMTAEGRHVQPVRTEWDGMGLPPVGTVCEALWSTVSGAATYATVKVLAHDEDRAVYRFLTLDRKGEYGSDTSAHIQGFAAFRPIRTAEQIAADERLHRIRNALSDVAKKVERWNVALDCSVAITGAVEAMIDAGYRKHE